jgi:hypothetical protein
MRIHLDGTRIGRRVLIYFNRHRVLLRPRSFECLVHVAFAAINSKSWANQRPSVNAAHISRGRVRDWMSNLREDIRTQTAHVGRVVVSDNHHNWRLEGGADNAITYNKKQLLAYPDAGIRRYVG